MTREKKNYLHLVFVQCHVKSVILLEFICRNGKVTTSSKAATPRNRKKGSVDAPKKSSKKTAKNVKKALKKANGSLFPFGWYHLMKAQRKNDTAAFYLIGVDPEYQGKGITALIFDEVSAIFRRKGITQTETNPELEENVAVQQLWKHNSPVKHKERSTFRIDLKNL